MRSIRSKWRRRSTTRKWRDSWNILRRFKRHVQARALIQLREENRRGLTLALEEATLRLTLLIGSQSRPRECSQHTARVSLLNHQQLTISLERKLKQMTERSNWRWIALKTLNSMCRWESRHKYSSMVRSQRKSLDLLRSTSPTSRAMRIMKRKWHQQRNSKELYNDVHLMSLVIKFQVKSRQAVASKFWFDGICDWCIRYFYYIY